MNRPSRRPAFALAFALALFLAAPSPAPAGPVVGFLSDFGLSNEYVGACKGAMLSVDPTLTLVDLCHLVPAFDVWEAGLVLRESTTFPKGTVFLAVVDPGVGGARSAIAVRTKRGNVYVAPNNGLLTWVIADQEVDSAVALDPAKINPAWRPGTFDGRDLLAPAAALIAKAKGKIASFGAPIREADLHLLAPVRPVVSPGIVHAVLEREEKPFGNAITNVTGPEMEAAGFKLNESLKVTFPDDLVVKVPYALTYSDVGSGEVLAYVDSRGRLAFAINMGSFVAKYGVRPGDRILVENR